MSLKSKTHEKKEHMNYKSKLGIATFFAIAFGIPWAGWFFVEDANLHLWLFPLFASLAGFAAAFAEGGKNGLKDFSVRVFSIVPALPYVLVGLVLPLCLGLTYLFVKGVPIFAMPWSPAAILALSLGAALITGPIAEEFGWRGYLQHRLLGRISPFWVALSISVIWWIWHFPLYRTSHFASFISASNFFAYLLTWSIFMVFLVQRAGGSVWPAVILHWAANTHPNVMQSLLPEVDGGFLPGGSKGALFYLSVACVFLVLKRRFFFDRLFK